MNPFVEALERAEVALTEKNREIEQLKAALAWEQKQHISEVALVAEIERLRNENENLRAEAACGDIKERDDEIHKQRAEIYRLRALLHRWLVWNDHEENDLAEETRAALEGKCYDEYVSNLKEEIERLRSQAEEQARIARAALEGKGK